MTGVSQPAQRLPWERKQPGQFVAYPRGRERPSYYAYLAQKPERSAFKWSWSVQAGETTMAGNAMSKQEAADAATVAWPQVLAEVERATQAAEALAALRSELDEIDRTGVVEVAEFGLGKMPYADLLELIKECRERWTRHFHARTISPGIESLMAAVSFELFRRRVGGRAPGWNR